MNRDENIIYEVKVTSKDAEECVESHDQQEYRGEKGSCLSPKLIGSKRQKSTQMRMRPTSRSTGPRMI